MERKGVDNQYMVLMLMMLLLMMTWYPLHHPWRICSINQPRGRISSMHAS